MTGPRSPIAPVGVSGAALAVLVAIPVLGLLAGCGADRDELGSQTAATTAIERSPSDDGATPAESGDRPTTTLVVSNGEASTDDPTSEPEPEPEPEPATVDPDSLALPTDAATQAEALVEAEAAIRDPAVPDDLAAAWGRRQQRLYRHLGRHPEWAEPVLALIDDPILGRAVERNWTARVNLDALVAAHGAQAEVPAWRITEPRPVDELLGYYRDGQAQWQVEWTYLAAINLIETRMGRIEGVSTAGAVGPMQFLPTTWAECCDGDPTDPADAIPGAARYLTVRGAPEDMAGAIWGYNNSDRYVAAVTAYAEVMRDDELAYRGYHAWEIFFLTTEGLVHLPVGYEELEAVPVADWLADHPDRLLP